MRSITAALLLTSSISVSAFELATTITRHGDTAKLETVGYAKVSLLRQPVSLTGSIVASGTLNVQGAVNIVMWSRVDGAAYFSKMPALQNIQAVSNHTFEIPFHAADKTVTEVVIEVEMLKAGSVSISGLTVKNIR